MSKAKSGKSAPKSTTRTKKKSTKRSKGLGDTIEKVTEATGIKAVVKFIAGEDCGCDERKEKLNKLFPYQQPQCMTQIEYDRWTRFKEESGERLTREEMEVVVRYHARLFNHPIHRPCTCTPKRWMSMIDEINQVYETYDEQDN